MKNKLWVEIVRTCIVLLVGFFGGMAVNITWDWWNQVDTNKIELFLRYAYNFTYPDGRTYKNAVPNDSENSDKIVDNEPIPFNINRNPKHEQSIVLGIYNNNKQPIDDVMFRLEFPPEFEVTTHEGWTNNGNNEYYTQLGNINSRVGHNTIKPINFIIIEPKSYSVKHKLSGRGFKAFERKIYFDVKDYTK